MICRGLCDCEYVLFAGYIITLLTNQIYTCICRSCAQTDKTPQLSFNIKPAIRVQPPQLKPIDLLYTQEEIWTRLQIREFIYRFGDVYGYDNRIMSNLQNVQGDWRVKKFGAYIVWKFLITLGSATNYESPLQLEENIPLQAKRILNQWMTAKDIHNLYLNTEDKHRSLLNVLYQEGMTSKRWQDIAELLAMAEFQDIPVPTSRDLTAMKTKLRDENDMDIDSGDDDELLQELEKRIRRYQKSVRSVSLLSIYDELKMINMLLQLLLFDGEIRQSLNAPCMGSKVKEVRDMESEFKKYKKEYLIEELKSKSKKSILSTRISQLKVIRGKEEELKQALTELDVLETSIRDERMSFESKKMELGTLFAKSQKRMEPVGQDHFGNTYWIFNDILNQVNNKSTESLDGTNSRNSEPYWAYGVVVIGPGFEKQDERWWYISGRKDITLLCDWLKQQHLENPTMDLTSLASKIYQRVEQLISLELVVYGEGFFA